MVILLGVLAGMVTTHNHCLRLFLPSQFLHNCVHVHFYRELVNKDSYYLNLLEDEAASWTVAEASLVLNIPPQEIIWLGCRDFPEVDPTKDFMVTPDTFDNPFYF